MVELLCFNISEVGVNFHTELVQDLCLLELLKELIDLVVSLLRVIKLVILEILHLSGVLGKVLWKSGDSTESCWQIIHLVSDCDYQQRLLVISRINCQIPLIFEVLDHVTRVFPILVGLAVKNFPIKLDISR